MKRVIYLALLTIAVPIQAAFAQSYSAAPERPISITGFGGFGFDNTNIQSGTLYNNTYHNLSTEVGLDANGFVYDPRLMDYSFSAYWDGNNSSIEQGSARSNGLSFNGNLSFLPERSFPFSIYFSRNRTNTNGSLIPAYIYTNDILGIRGEIKKPKLALIDYNFGESKDLSGLANGLNFNTRQRFANINASRKLWGWDMRLTDDYLNSRSTLSNFRDRTNTTFFDASRFFSRGIRANLDASRSSFDFSDLAGNNRSTADVTVLDGSVTWKHTENLDSYYNFIYSNNSVNTLQLLSEATGTTGLSLPFNAVSEQSNSETFGSGVNYRATSYLSLSGTYGYTHNGLPESTVATLPQSVRNLVTTDTMNVGGGFSVNHKIWKLDYMSSTSLTWQDFSLLSGNSDSGTGVSIQNSLGGGDIRKARVTVGFAYDTRSSPFFFNVVRTDDKHATLKLESQYFRFVRIDGSADVGTTHLSLNNSNINLNTNSFMLSLTARHLTLYGSHGLTNSAERFFGEDSLLFQSGGSTGGLVIPLGLLNPLVYSDVMTERVGLLWQPRSNFSLESRLSESRYLFTFLNNTQNTYREFDTTANYKFGRFTIIGGYGRATGTAFLYNNLVNRYFIRIRFPFHIL